jgi:hypothetical protein
MGCGQLAWVEDQLAWKSPVRLRQQQSLKQALAPVFGCKSSGALQATLPHSIAQAAQASTQF